MKPTISIVIRALNEAEHIGRLLTGVATQSLQPDEVILVDSGSTDGTIEIASRFDVKTVHIPPSEFTFGRSLNLGCAEAKGDLLVFVSAHVYPLTNRWLEQLVEPFSDDEVELSYGGQTGDDRSNFAELQLLKQWFPETDDLDQKHPFCNNANCAVRSKTWEQHPYDESLPGLEDLAFAQRVLDEGGRIAYVADARIAHVHEESLRGTVNRYRREALALREIDSEAELRAPTALKLIGVAIANDVAAAWRSKALGSVRTACQFRVAQYLGAWLGHRTRRTPNEVVKRMYYPRP